MQSSSGTSRPRDALTSTSVAARLVDLQTHLQPNNKIPWMADRLFCLRIDGRGRRPRLTQVRVNTDHCSQYIAVSYPWTHTPALERETAGSYWVIDIGSEERRLRRSQVRDVVLKRVIAYARNTKLRRFWIDGECIGQRDSPTKQQAMNAMDLVYSRSAHPLGLLAVTLRTRGQLDALRALLSGDFLATDPDPYPAVPARCRGADARRILALLRRLSRDRWWSRAWIFQEEYLSSTRMHLLVRYRPGLVVPEGLKHGSGDIRFKASVFREQATRFLLAVRGHLPITERRHCARLLRMFGKYNVLYRSPRDSSCQAMTSRVLSDIGRRRISEPYDLLPIAANSCNYALRFDSGAMKGLGHHINLCVVAMCLANGELMRDAAEIRDRPDEMSLERCMRHIFFDRFAPPVESKELSYLKTCRLHDVWLDAEGVRARGHLWTVVETVDPQGWRSPLRRSRKISRAGLSDAERDHLFLLLHFLRKRPRHWRLVEYLEEYLGNDLRDRDSMTPSREHMDIMAGAVAVAMRDGRPLYLVAQGRGGPTSGILTDLRDGRSRAFTSWCHGVDEDGQRRHKRMSLEVEVERPRRPLLRALRWVNGLVFFENRESQPVVFRWPRAWDRGISTQT